MKRVDAYNALVGKSIILEDGDTITFIKNLHNINMYKELFKRFPSYNEIDDIKAVNEKINQNIVEAFSASKKTVSNEEPKSFHLGIDSFDTRDVYLYDGNVAYLLRLTIGNLTDGNKIAYAKRRVEIARKEITEKIKRAETQGETPLNQLNNIVPDSSANVNTESGKKQVKVDSEGRKLSEAQSKFFEKSKIRDEDGKTIHSFVYANRTPASRVVNDIINYFDNGTVPSADTRSGNTNITDFLYSERDQTFGEVNAALRKENEKLKTGNG